MQTSALPGAEQARIGRIDFEQQFQPAQAGLLLRAEFCGEAARIQQFHPTGQPIALVRNSLNFDAQTAQTLHSLANSCPGLAQFPGQPTA
jgi:hypothetical protein